MGRPESIISLEPFVALLGLLTAVALGAWWTGMAVADGDAGATVVRFSLATAGGCYYVVLYRIARFSAYRTTRRFR